MQYCYVVVGGCGYVDWGSGVGRWWFFGGLVVFVIVCFRCDKGDLKVVFVKLLWLLLCKFDEI